MSIVWTFANLSKPDFFIFFPSLIPSTFLNFVCIKPKSLSDLKASPSLIQKFPAKLGMGGTKYYAVKKGRNPGIYDTWNDCKRQVDGYAGNQYKSFTSLKEAQDYIAEDTHVPQAVFLKQDDGYSANSNKILASRKKEARSSEQDVPEVQITTKKQKKDQNNRACHAQGAQMTSKKQGFYHLEFDGASKGNPGIAGAGAVLRNPDGSVLCRIKEGVGVATNNVSEYRAIIRGLKVCLLKGIDCIHVRGDSNLVCMQIQDKWQTRNANIADLSKEAKELKSKFKEFRIDHVLREFNSDADALANEAIFLPDGEWVLS